MKSRETNLQHCPVCNLMISKESMNAHIGQSARFDEKHKLYREKKFQFITLKEAEKFYEEHINSNSNNMNPEFENALDAWLEDNADEIEECRLENNIESAEEHLTTPSDGDQK